MQCVYVLLYAIRKLLSKHDKAVWLLLQDCTVLGVRQPFASAMFVSNPDNRKIIENRSTLQPNTWMAVLALQNEFDAATVFKGKPDQIAEAKQQMIVARDVVADIDPLPYSMLIGFIHIDECVDYKNLIDE